MLTSSTAFDVTKGEDAPEIGDTGPVTGIAHKDCSWKVPYKVRLQSLLSTFFGNKNNIVCLWWSNAAGILFLFKANPFWPKLRRSRLKGNVDGVFLKLN